jgi:hypothetical protein
MAEAVCDEISDWNFDDQKQNPLRPSIFFGLRGFCLVLAATRSGVRSPSVPPMIARDWVERLIPSFFTGRDFFALRFPDSQSKMYLDFFNGLAYVNPWVFRDFSLRLKSLR